MDNSNYQNYGTMPPNYNYAPPNYGSSLPTYDAPPPAYNNYYPSMDPYQNRNYNQTRAINHNMNENNFNSPAINLGSLDDEVKLSMDLDVTIRHAFARKVFTIVGLQLLFTAAVGFLFTYVDSMRAWMRDNYLEVTLPAGIGAIVVVFALVCYKKVARSVPINYILLGLLTIGFSLCVAGIGAVSDPYAFALAAAITTVITLALFLFAMQVKYDFTGLLPYVLCFSLVFLVFAIMAIIFRSQVMLLVYSCLGALLVSFYIVLDVQMIIGGKHRSFSFSIDDYIVAAASLYIDIVNLFMYILTIINASS